METTQEKPKTNAVTLTEENSVWMRVAKRYGFTYDQVRSTVMNTLMPRREGKLLASEADMAAALVLADQYGLNLFAKEIYFTPGKGGGLLSIVGLDGWVKIANSQAEYDGWGYEEKLEIAANGGKTKSIETTATIHFKTRSHPCRITESWEECKRNSDPWRDMPRRMLRNRAFCQAVRNAFGIGGIMLEDEAADLIATVEHTTISSRPLSASAALSERISGRAAEITQPTPVESEATPEPFVMSAEESSRRDREDNADATQGRD